MFPNERGHFRFAGACRLLHIGMANCARADPESQRRVEQIIVAHMNVAVDARKNAAIFRFPNE